MLRRSRSLPYPTHHVRLRVDLMLALHTTSPWERNIEEMLIVLHADKNVVTLNLQ